MDKIFMERLSILRKERDLTMDMLVMDMREKFPDIKIEKSMVSRWENGISLPTWDYAKKLSAYFNVSLDYLAGLTDTRTPSRLLAKTVREDMNNLENEKVKKLMLDAQEEFNTRNTRKNRKEE